MKSMTLLMIWCIALVECSAQSAAGKGTVSDVEGNMYHTVKIGNQVWTSENYQAAKFNDGTPIPMVSDSLKWCSLKSPGYCVYKNNLKNKKKYGALYNLHAVNSKKFAPKGWHAATVADWDTLSNYLTTNKINCNDDTSDYRIGKALAAKTDWDLSFDPTTNPCAVGVNMQNNNRTGFTALPGGTRQHCDYRGIGLVGYWWGLDNTGSPRVYFMDSHTEELSSDIDTEGYGCSVRLVKDDK